MPQGHRDSIPPVLAATSPGLAVVRMHGHSAKWDDRDIHERFGYRYTDDELAEWAPKVRALARDAAETQVLFNNCYRNYAQVNAEQLSALLGPDRMGADCHRNEFFIGAHSYTRSGMLAHVLDDRSTLPATAAEIFHVSGRKPERRLGAPRSPFCLHGTPSADDLVLYVEADGCRRPYGSMKVNLGGVHGIRTDR